MQLKNIILTIAAISLFSTAFADTGMMASGGTYAGIAAGWGGVTTDSQGTNWLNSFDNVTEASSQSGGFSGRVYVGYLSSFNPASAWLFGPEIDYSYYHNNTYTARFDLDNNPIQNITQSGYGIDFLLNATYMLSNTVNIAIKPGFQYASEKFSTPFVVTDGAVEPNSALSMNTTSVLPEINLEANWQVMPNKPLFIGASYQYVWGNGINNVDDFFNTGSIAASSRDMLALNVEYKFN